MTFAGSSDGTSLARFTSLTGKAIPPQKQKTTSDPSPSQPFRLHIRIWATNGVRLCSGKAHRDEPRDKNCLTAATMLRKDQSASDNT
jgi:hypothetical protein